MTSNRIFALFIIIGTFCVFHPARMQYSVPYAIQTLFNNNTYTRSFNANHLKLVTKAAPIFYKLGNVTEVRETGQGRIKIINHYTNENAMTRYVCYKNICSNDHGREILETLLFFVLLIFSFHLMRTGRSIML